MVAPPSLVRQSTLVGLPAEESPLRELFVYYENDDHMIDND